MLCVCACVCACVLLLCVCVCVCVCVCTLSQAWHKGEGWPQWSAGMAALYATSLVAASVLNTFDTTLAMDAHTDSDGLLAGFFHLHSRHGDSNFSKFEMLKDEYRAVRTYRSSVRQYGKIT